MITHYFHTAIRQMRKSALFSTINLLGFVLGMAAAFLIYLWVVNELTFDDCFPDIGRTYRVVEMKQSNGDEITESPSTIIPLAAALRDNFPQVEAATAFKSEHEYSFSVGDGKSISGHHSLADASFFSIFPFPVVEGNIERFAATPKDIVLSEDMARKLFGKASAVGQQVVWEFSNR
jgi:putative ABC transport system permease protein